MKVILLIMIGVSILNAEFSRDNSAEIVYDSNTGLYWQDNSDSGTFVWQDTIEYCENLELNAYTDWRLPNINELASLIDDTKSSPAIPATFLNTNSSYYWSSTSLQSESTNAWGVGFNDGSVGHNSKGYSYYVRCVRAGQ